MNIVFFGTPQIAAQLAQSLTPDINIQACVTGAPKPQGRKQILTPSPVHTWATSQNIPVLYPSSLKNQNFLDQLTSISCEAWLVFAYGKIMPEWFLDLFSKKVINIHPSLLPLYRGPSPLQAPLLNGDTYTGVSLMLMDKYMDHGHLLAQEEIPLNQQTTLPQLEHQVLAISQTLTKKTLPLYLEGKITPIPQKDDQATYTSLITKQDGEINWLHSAYDIWNQYRAYCQWPEIYTWHKNTKITLELTAYHTESLLSPGEWSQLSQTLLVGTSYGEVEVSHIKPSGKPWLTPHQFAQIFDSKGRFNIAQFKKNMT